MTTQDNGTLVKNTRDLDEILGNRDRVIALFYASWCPFCIRFLPIFQGIAAREGACFVMVQDDQETIADRYAIEIFPTVLFFENGLVRRRLDGVAGRGLNEAQLTEFCGFCLG